MPPKAHGKAAPKPKPKAKGKARAKVGAKARAKAGAKAAGRPARGLGLGLQRPGARILRAAAKDKPEDKKLSLEEALAADLLIAEGEYWSAEAVIAGKALEVTTKEGERYYTFEVRGTKSDSVPTYLSGVSPRHLQVHLCGDPCPKKLWRDGLFHLKKLTQWSGEEEDWMSNLKEAACSSCHRGRERRAGSLERRGRAVERGGQREEEEKEAKQDKIQREEKEGGKRGKGKERQGETESEDKAQERAGGGPGADRNGSKPRVQEEADEKGKESGAGKIQQEEEKEERQEGFLWRRRGEQQRGDIQFIGSEAGRRTGQGGIFWHLINSEEAGPRVSGRLDGGLVGRMSGFPHHGSRPNMGESP